jgi:hypothetical protein
MREGKCHYFIGDKSYDIIAGDIILIPNGTLHGTSYGSKPCTRLLVNFDTTFISEEVLRAISAVGYLYRNPNTITAMDRLFDAIEYVKTNKTYPVPPYLQDAHYGGAANLGRGTGYKYAHLYPNHYVKQQYLPDEVVGTKFYKPSDMGYEKNITEHLNKIYGEADGRSSKN